MLPKEYNGSKCEIKASNNRLIASGTLSVLNAEEVEVYDKAGPMPILDMDDSVKLVVHHAKLGTKILAARVYISNRRFMRLINLVSYSEYEQRRFFRLPIDHSADLIYPSGEVDGAGKEGWEIRPARVKDVSLCGMLVESDLPFTVGDEFKLRMTLADNLPETMDLIVRRIAWQDDKGKSGYGCELLNMSSRAEQRLGAFVLREQQNQIRRSRGK